MGVLEKSDPDANSLQRVKVYRMSDDGKWEDQGTGHVTVDYVERSEDMSLSVVDEEDSETLLMHRINPDDIYRKQEDTIISWKDPEFSTELAISFQESAGCSYIWDNICTVQRNLQFNTLTNDMFHRVNSELRELPAVELSTLPLILKTVAESRISDQMRVIELIINDHDYLKKLMEVHKICEDLENIDGLHMIFKIIRGIIQLNSPQIFEKLFGDELIMDIIGSLEFDPEVRDIQHHRNVLNEHVFFKEAIPIKDPMLLSKIHQTFRVGYLKDVILCRALDEATVANLNSIIHSNNAIVISLLKDDSTFIQEVFARLRSPTTSLESKKNLVYFLHEFCSLSKSLQMVQQLRLFRDLISEGIFDIIGEALQSADQRLVLTGTDILILFLNQDPNLLRTYVIQQEGKPLLGLLVKGMITDFGDHMHCQFLEILRTLLDSYVISGAQRETVIEIFYEQHLGELINFITSSCQLDGANQTLSKSVVLGERAENQKSAKPEIIFNICELLCFCVLHHPYRIKSFFLLNNVIAKVLLLTRRREKSYVVASVRFVRTILSRHDDHLTTHIIKHNLLKPIVDAFVANGNRYNLLHSGVLELFEYIWKENLKSLVKYLVDSFWGELVKFENFAAIRSLRLKYDQILDDSAVKSPEKVSEPRKRTDARGLDKEEEDYFNEDSDEEDTDSASISNTRKLPPQPSLVNGNTTSYPSSPRSGGLVDYDDDDDDGDYRPPPRKEIEATDLDEVNVNPIRIKRKSDSNEKDHIPTKKQRLGKNLKQKDSVFAALCSTLSHVVLPTKKSILSEVDKSSEEANHREEESALDRTDSHEVSLEDYKKEEETTTPVINCESSENSSEKKDVDGEDCPPSQPKLSPDIEVETTTAVNGSEILENSSEKKDVDGEDCPPSQPKLSPDIEVETTTAVNGSEILENSSESRGVDGEDCPPSQPKLSPDIELAVNGS